MVSKRGRTRALALLAALFVAATARAAPKPESALPPDLDLLPRDAAFFLSMRVGDLCKSETTRELRDRFAKGRSFPQNPSATLAILLPDIERLTLVSPPPTRVLTAVVHTARPYDRAAILAAFGKAEEKKHRGQTYYEDTSDFTRFLYLVDDRTLVVGPFLGPKGRPLGHEFLEWTWRRKGDGPLAETLGVASRKHHLVLGLNPAATSDKGPADLPEPLRPLQNARSAVLAIDLGPESLLELELTFADEDAAAKGEKALRTGADMARDFLTRWLKEVDAQTKCTLPHSIRFLHQASAALKEPPVRRQGIEVHAGVRVRSDLATVSGALAEGISLVLPGPRR